jgi:small subunit ribosomal protein S2
MTEAAQLPIEKKELLEAGVHFGHPTRRWNPKMRPYIFQKRNGIYIIDLEKTVTMLVTAYQFVRDLTARGGSILFVGTKRQAQEIIREEARRCGAYYVNHRWVGGLLTNWGTVRKRIERLRYLDSLTPEDFQKLPKKEAKVLRRERDTLAKLYEGVRDMPGLPDALYIVDLNKEAIAVQEARRLQIPIVAILDTNCDPDPVDYPIPGNDDAVRSIKIFSSKIADAVLEGMRLREGGFVLEPVEPKIIEPEIPLQPPPEVLEVLEEQLEEEEP